MELLRKKLVLFFLIVAVSIFLFNSFNTREEPKVLDWYINNNGSYNPTENIDSVSWGSDVFQNNNIDINLKRDYSNIISRRKATVSILDTKINRNIPHLNKYFDNINQVRMDKNSNWNFVENNYDIFEKSDVFTHASCSISILINTLYKMDCDTSQYSINSYVVYSNEGDNDIAKLVSAIKYAEERGTNICCISLNTSTYSDELYNAMKNSSMLFVVSAGNDGVRLETKEDGNYPTCFNLPNIISVAAIRCDGKISEASNYGKLVDVSAPGSDILVHDTRNRHYFISGTSYSVPMVAALAALIFTKNPTTPDSVQIKRYICDNCNKKVLLSEKTSHNGMIDVEQSMNSIIM